jgi:RNA 3'-terminal phosphate cyclase (ATP)
MFQIDGAYGEGGGQILRSALTLSIITQQPIYVTNIRAQRTNPGIRPQHLTAIKAAQTISKGHVEGAAIGSTSIRFFPAKVEHGQYSFRIATAGAATLVLQAILIPLTLAGGVSQVRIQGGTHVPWSPCFEYLSFAWLPILSKLGFSAQLKCERAGFYPRGGGVIQAIIHPVTDPSPIICTQRGQLQSVHVLSAVAQLPEQIGDRQTKRAQERLGSLSVPVDYETRKYPSNGKGTFVFLAPEFPPGKACFFALGAPGKPAERVSDEAMNHLEEFLALEGALDPWLADQILIPLALASGNSQFSTTRISQHLLTNAVVLETFGLARVSISGQEGDPGVIQVTPNS